MLMRRPCLYIAHRHVLHTCPAIRLQTFGSLFCPHTVSLNPCFVPFDYVFLLFSVMKSEKFALF